MQVIPLVLGRRDQMLCNLGIISHQGLSLVKRLRANFANMIHPHQRCGLRLLCLIHVGH